MEIVTTEKDIGQYAPGQGKRERHEFFLNGKNVAFVDTEQWPENGYLVLSGEMRVDHDHQRTITRTGMLRNRISAILV